jgi:hypothetical protein
LHERLAGRAKRELRAKHEHFTVAFFIIVAVFIALTVRVVLARTREFRFAGYNGKTVLSCSSQTGLSYVHLLYK